MTPITVTAQGPPDSPARLFLSKNFPCTEDPTHDSPLLRAIKAALRGPNTTTSNSIHTAVHFTGNRPNEPELTWNEHTAILSYGSVMVKRWSFGHEKELIQWACLGELEQVIQQNPSSSTTAASYASQDTEPPPPAPDGRETFGPFARARNNRKFDAGKVEIVPAVFIFLRSIGKIYLSNGVDYTFSLPFIVRRAWPISPHGVMLQRVLEPAEVAEAEETGDDILPTIFTITSALSEASAVGMTSGILGPTRDAPASLTDEDEHSSKPLISVPPTEMIVWVSHCGIVADARIAVTVDVEKRLLSIWQYVYVKPKDTPVPLTRRAKAPKAKAYTKRQSMSGVGNRRTSAMFDGRDRIHPMSPNPRAREPVLPSELFDLPDMPPLSSLPNMAPSLSTTTTMASLVSGATGSQSQTQRTAPSIKRRNSLSRNDLSMTMDRMVLGGRFDTETLTPIEHGRMKASFWMQNMLTRPLSDEEYVHH